MVEPRDDGLALYTVTIVMLILSWIVVLGRIAVRRWIQAFGNDDILMCIGLDNGQAIFTALGVLLIVICYYGAGYPSRELDSGDIMQGTKLYFIATIVYAVSTVPIKCSICVAFLRIAGPRRRFTWPVWGIMGITITSSLIFIIITANICHPIQAFWGEKPGECNITLNSDMGYFLSAISISTDWALAILPTFMLWNVQLRRQVKVSVAIILALAAFASCATIVRLRFIVFYNNPDEFMLAIGKVPVWSVCEDGIGIIAGSMPALRPLLKYLPGHYGSGSNATLGYGGSNATPNRRYKEA